jgi:hypothetical protein
MASAIGDLPETRASCCSSHALEHEGCAFLLAHGAALAGALPPDRLFDYIEFRSTLKCLAGDRSGAILGDVEEPAPKMRPAKGECNRLAASCIGDVLVGTYPSRCTMPR